MSPTRGKVCCTPGLLIVDMIACNFPKTSCLSFDTCAKEAQHTPPQRSQGDASSAPLRARIRPKALPEQGRTPHTLCVQQHQHDSVPYMRTQSSSESHQESARRREGLVAVFPEQFFTFGLFSPPLADLIYNICYSWETRLEAPAGSWERGKNSRTFEISIFSRADGAKAGRSQCCSQSTFWAAYFCCHNGDKATPSTRRRFCRQARSGGETSPLCCGPDMNRQPDKC